MSKLNVLIALPYLDPSTLEYLKEHQDGIRFLLDSGAFTAWKKNEEIPLSGFCKAIERLPFKPWRYFTLDKIGDAKGTRDNFATLLKSGFKPIPIFTRGEALEEIDWYYEHSDLVGVGGLVGTPGNQGFVKGLMKKIGKRRCHWLGFTSPDYVSYYRPYSCDSSSWSRGVRYALINLYCGGGKWRTLNKQNFAKRPEPEIFKQFELYGEDIYRLAREEEWKNSGTGKFALERICFKSWTRYQIEVGKILGTKFFVAVASKEQVRLMHEAHQYWTSHPLYRVGSLTPASRNASLRS